MEHCCGNVDQWYSTGGHYQLSECLRMITCRLIIRHQIEGFCEMYRQ